MEILFLTGIIIFLGASAGKLFQKLKIPQVVGYIIIGVLLGESVFGVLKHSTIEMFTPIINMALGLIGFRIGAELKGDVFKRYGRSIYTILFSEGFFAFVAVTILVTLITKKLYLGLLLGAIASATAPAATTDVLWEYKTRGPLTSTLLAIVALDDGLALIIYGFASVFAKSMVTGTDFTLLHSVGGPLLELSKSCLLGASIGYGLTRLLVYIKDKDRVFTFSIATVILTVGLAVMLKLDFILSAMVLGAVFANLSGESGNRVFKSIEKFTPPIFILFFVLVGARLQAKIFLNVSIALLALVYLIGRTSGKVAGAWFGGFISKAEKSVTKYLGLCLFSQAGVAIGLAMVVYHNFSLLGAEGKEVGALVLNIITATTFVVQLIGPSCVKFAVTKADEVWRNVTKEDIIGSLKVSDVMRRNFHLIQENATLGKVIDIVKKTDSYHFPAVNSHNELTGLISLGGLRNAFMEQHLNHVILAKDVAEPVGKMLYQDQTLEEAFEIFDKREIDYLPVVERMTSYKVVGILEYKHLIEEVDIKLLQRQQELVVAKSVHIPEKRL
ncbi:MAG: cation:proton antiporter [Candidatus Orphnella occulta]|nr:cation:proton antiporter [Candidatus Orphnella occulta]MDP8297156.1 cation:proton antiporter [Candidatus Orphnella occulta]